MKRNTYTGRNIWLGSSYDLSVKSSKFRKNTLLFSLAHQYENWATLLDTQYLSVGVDCI